MSFENLYEFVSGEFQDITRKEQLAAGESAVWIRDENDVKLGGYLIELWTAATAGTQLTEGVDYNLVNRDDSKSDQTGFEIYAGYQVLTVGYQSVSLYLNMRVIGGYTAHPYRPTYSEVTASATAAPSSLDDSVLADATAGAMTITLPDGDRKNQRISVICTGGNEVTVTGTGLSVSPFTDIVVAFVWDGAAWLQLGGAGTGSAPTLQVPQPKTWVEKWNDGGAGNITTKLNEWGDGIYIIRVKCTYLAAIEKQPSPEYKSR